MSIFQKLNAPAPSSFSEPLNLKEFFFSGLFIFLFLALLQPFGYANIPGTLNKWVYAFGYGLLTAIILGLYHFIFHQLFIHRILHLEKYKVWHSILNILTIILMIGIGNYLFSIIIFTGFQLSWHDFLVFLTHTLIVGIFPAIFIPFYTYFKLLKKNMVVSEAINKYSASPPNSNEMVKIISSAKEESLELPKNQILYFMAQGNYIQVVYLNENHLQVKKMIRATMKSLEENLSGHSEFLRIHRSYIVNRNQIVKSTGNAQGITLFLKNTEKTVPVSRKFIPTIKKVLT